MLIMNSGRSPRLVGGVLAVLGIGGLAASTASSSFILLSDPELKPVAYEYHYRQKLFSGVGYERHGNGKLGRLAFFWSGKKVWREYQWYASGGIWSESGYDFNGRRQGDWRMWHPDGKPKSLTHYVDDQRQGEQWAWHPNGTLIEYNVHRDDATVTHKSWIFDGTPHYNYVYQQGEVVGVKGGDFCRPDRLKVQ
jgi:hypothetical protein